VYDAILNIHVFRNYCSMHDKDKQKLQMAEVRWMKMSRRTGVYWRDAKNGHMGRIKNLPWWSHANQRSLITNKHEGGQNQFSEYILQL